MKKKLLIITIILCLCSLPFLLAELKGFTYIHRQRQLATLLGVNIKDYRPADFPHEYVARSLVPGMTIREVHKVIRGYEKVLHCGDYSEIYYYFSINDDEAFKYEVIYDEKTLKSFATDDIYNSWRISSDGCVRGLLEE